MLEGSLLTAQPASAIGRPRSFAPRAPSLSPTCRRARGQALTDRNHPTVRRPPAVPEAPPTRAADPSRCEHRCHTNPCSRCGLARSAATKRPRSARYPCFPARPYPRSAPEPNAARLRERRRPTFAPRCHPQSPAARRARGPALTDRDHPTARRSPAVAEATPTRSRNPPRSKPGCDNTGFAQRANDACYTNLNTPSQVLLTLGISRARLRASAACPGLCVPRGMATSGEPSKRWHEISPPSFRHAFP